MLLALWPLFIATQVVLPPEEFNGGGSRHTKQVKAEAQHVKHVELHISTSQKQEITGTISAVSAPHNVSLFANTGQKQGITGSITTRNLVTKVVSSPDKFVSTHYRLNVATAQVQSIAGNITADVPEISFWNILNTAQNHYVVGKITLSEPASVSTYSLANVSTAQVQETSVSISVVKQSLTTAVSVKAATHQHQAISGRITTNDDDEMLMVLMALLELDSDVG